MDEIIDDVETMILRRGIRLGFAASREGFNGECAYDHLAPEPYSHLKDIEDAAVRAFIDGELDQLTDKISKTGRGGGR